MREQAVTAVQSDATTPDHILEIGFAFRKSKTLLSAVELGVFPTLADGPPRQLPTPTSSSPRFPRLRTSASGV